MKNSTWIFLVIILFAQLLGCRLGGDDMKSIPELARAEQLMLQHPDSSLMILDTIAHPEVYAPAHYALYALLRTEAGDKNYETFTSDSLISIASRHYAHGEDSWRKARAYYYHGMVLYDFLHCSDTALHLLLQAYETAKKNKHDRVLMLVCSRLSSLYADQRMFKEAYGYASIALNICEVLKDSLNLPYTMSDMAVSYILDDKIDSAKIWYKQGLLIAQNTNNHSAIADLTNNLAVLYVGIGELQEALLCCRILLNSKKQFSAQNYSLYGSIYLKNNKLDSARYYINQGIQIGSIKLKSRALKNLAKVDYLQGNYKDAYDHYKLSEVLSDSLRGEEQKESIHNLTVDFEKRLLESEFKRRRQAKYFGFGLFGFLMFSSLGWMINKYRVVRRQRALLKKRLEETQIKMNELETQSFALQHERFKLHPIYPGLVEKKVLLKTQAEIEPFEVAINSVYSGFAGRLRQMFPRLKSSDIVFCCLLVAQFKIVAISELLAMDESSASRKKRNIHEKINSITPCDDLMECLIAIVRL